MPSEAPGLESSLAPKQMPSFYGFLPQETSSLMAPTHLALTFLRLGAGLGSLFHASSFIIKAQCSSDIYSTGGRGSKGEGEKTPPPLQRVPAFHPKGHLGRGDWLLWIKALSAWDKLEGHGCHFVSVIGNFGCDVPSSLEGQAAKGDGSNAPWRGGGAPGIPGQLHPLAQPPTCMRLWPWGLAA